MVRWYGQVMVRSGYGTVGLWYGQVMVRSGYCTIRLCQLLHNQYTLIGEVMLDIIENMI